MSGSTYNERGFGFAHEGVTYYVRALILVTTGVYVAQLLLDIPFGNRFVFDPPAGRAMLDWLTYSNSKLLRGWVWTPFTYIFLHGGLQHLFFNMLQLYFFGPEVERLLGTRQFIRFYFFCGVVGVLGNLVPLVFGVGNANVLGASGAVLGVLVAFAIIDPDRQLFLFPLPFPITARALIIVIVAMNLLNAVSGGTVSVATHFGGMTAAYVYMKLRPKLLQRNWDRRGRRVKKGRRGRDTDKDRMADAIDNIFKFQDKDRR